MIIHIIFAICIVQSHKSNLRKKQMRGHVFVWISFLYYCAFCLLMWDLGKMLNLAFMVEPKKSVCSMQFCLRSLEFSKQLWVPTGYTHKPHCPKPHPVHKKHASSFLLRRNSWNKLISITNKVKTDECSHFMDYCPLSQPCLLFLTSLMKSK